MQYCSTYEKQYGKCSCVGMRYIKKSHVHCGTKLMVIFEL